MKILKNNVDALISKVKYTFEKVYDDQEMNTLFNLWRLFDTRETEIRDVTGETVETVLYSKYYWCTKYKNLYNRMFGGDVGLDQQQYRIIEEINRRVDSVDWELIQMIEEENTR